MGSRGIQRLLLSLMTYHTAHIFMINSSIRTARGYICIWNVAMPTLDQDGSNTNNYNTEYYVRIVRISPLRRELVV